MRQFFKNMLYPLEPEDVSQLYTEEIALSLQSYQFGSPYVGGLPTYFFNIVSFKEPRQTLGFCDLRLGMSENIIYAGHIGYRVLHRHRGHHYAEKASRLLLHFAYELGMREVIITCDPDNAASRRTLERLGGELRGIVEVPPSSSCYAAGDRMKCQFYYDSKDFYLPEKHSTWIKPQVW